ncbi:MAG: S41 family peptidase [Dysgonamonadaceae bacterium]|jgi:carboxyl-terminal processing protease|nr:S41 family peptidase [Dysgonamonadaceae bacterium]
MSKRLNWKLIIFILIALIAGFFAGNFFSSKSLSRKLFLNKKNKIDLVLDIINEEYVDTINIQQMIENSIPKIVGELDPHSDYIPAGSLETLKESMDGHFAGIGIEYAYHRDTLVVSYLSHGGPAEQAGILAGDRIVAINDSSYVSENFSEEKIENVMRGKVGSPLKLNIKRNNSDSLLTFRIIRTYIPTKTVKAAYELSPGVGIIKIAEFSHTTYDEFVNAMARLKNCNSLILDLRSNKGGSFDAAIKICNEFLPEGRVIVYAEGKSFPRENVEADGSGTLQKCNLAVLMDEISASASEIVAGAIQDNDRGLIIGRRSYGKGLIQNQIELSDGSALRLTIARYFTPSGRNIQRKYELGNSEGYNQEWIERLVKEGFTEEDPSRVVDTAKVFHTLNGRKVYGGGGIMPDIFVPMDTSELTSYYIKLEKNDVFRSFAFDYSDSNRGLLKSFENWQGLLKYLNSQDLLDEVVLFAEKKGVKRRSNLIYTSANQIVNMTSAYILQNFYGEEMMYYTILNNDKMVKKAVETLKNEKEGLNPLLAAQSE